MQSSAWAKIGACVPGVIIIVACAYWTGSLIGRAAAGDNIAQAVSLLFVPILTAIMVAQYAATFLASRVAAISLQFCYVISIGLVGYATVQAKPEEATFGLVAIAILGFQILASWKMLSNHNKDAQRSTEPTRSHQRRLPHVLALGGLAVVVGFFAVTEYQNNPPISLRNASPAEVNASGKWLRIPAEAKDVCVEHKGFQTRLEFSIDEAGFRKWADEQFDIYNFCEKSRRVFEILRPATAVRYDNSSIVVENGLMAEDEPQDGAPRLVYDAKTQRAYFYCWYAPH